MSNIQKNSLKFILNTTSENDVVNQIFKINSEAYGNDGKNITVIRFLCPPLHPFYYPPNKLVLEKLIIPILLKRGIYIPKITPSLEVKDQQLITVLPTLLKVLERAMKMQTGEPL